MAPDEPGFWFSPPANAIPVDLDDPAARAAWLRHPAVDEGDRAALAELQALLVAQLRAGGACYAAHLVGVTADGVTTALLSARITPVDLGDGELLDAIGSAYAGPRARCVAAPVALPCGPAELIVEDNTVGAPGGGTTAVRTAQLAVPGGGHLLQLVLCTEDRAGWSSWMRLFGLVAGSISVTEPGRGGPGSPRIAEALGV